MKFMYLQFYLLMWFQVSWASTDQLTALGQNVTINCSLDEEEVIWSLLKLDSPFLILRTFKTSVPFYFNDTLRHKYSVQNKHSLFINKVTIDELGVYYCMEITAPQKYSNSTRLHIAVYFTEPDENIHNHTVVESIETNPTKWQISVLISALLNAVLIIVIIGLLRVFKRTRDTLRQFQDTNQQQHQVMDLEQRQAPSQVQYASVDFSAPCQRFQSRQINGTYAFLELPK